MFWAGSKRALREAGEKIEELSAQVRRLQDENNRIGAILDSMVEGVIVIDKNSVILSLNPTIGKIFGVSRDCIGKLFLEVIPNNELYEIAGTVMRKGEALVKEIGPVWPVQKIFRVSASPVFEKAQVNACLLVIHDVTEVRKLERIRSDFVANVSHELKTPLTSIKGFVETLLEGALEDRENSREFLRIIQDHADRLNRLVNDLLELSSLESRQIKLIPEPFDLCLAVSEVLSGFRSQLEKRSLAAENGVEALFVDADRGRICQVLTNLVDNAIKYTREKTVIRVLSEKDRSSVKVIVQDEGQGIPARELPRLFERFYRVDKARSREMGGTGLGLSIVKHIVELHGGAVGVESTEAVGSRFWFSLPLGR